MTRTTLIVGAVVAVVAAALLWWLIGEAAVPGAVPVGIAVAEAARRREQWRQAAQEDADDVIGGLGPDPATLRQEAAQEDAEIAAHVDEVPLEQLLREERERVGRG